jgi:hypothetical protein
MKTSFLLLVFFKLPVQDLHSSAYFPNDTSCQATTAIRVSREDCHELTSDTISNTNVYSGDSLIVISEDTLLVPADTVIHLPDTITLIMVGDVMLGTNYPSAQYLPPGNNCAPLLDSVRQYLLDADITFCNLEGVFAGDKGSPKNCKDPKTCYVFRMPDEYVNCLTDAGFDLVSVANNHVNDFGYEGRMHAVEVLKKSGLYFAGFAVILTQYSTSTAFESVSVLFRQIRALWI